MEACAAFRKDPSPPGKFSQQPSLPLHCSPGEEVKGGNPKMSWWDCRLCGQRLRSQRTHPQAIMWHNNDLKLCGPKVMAQIFPPTPNASPGPSGSPGSHTVNLNTGLPPTASAPVPSAPPTFQVPASSPSPSPPVIHVTVNSAGGNSSETQRPSPGVSYATMAATVQELTGAVQTLNDNFLQIQGEYQATLNGLNNWCETVMTVNNHHTEQLNVIYQLLNIQNQNGGMQQAPFMPHPLPQGPAPQLSPQQF
jgi:hypothetical protein